MKISKLILSAMAITCFAGFANAQDPNYVVSLADDDASQVTVLMDSSAGTDVQGWSWGVCNDATITPTDVADGSTTATVNGGGSPDFNTINIFPEGWTVGVVISFVGTASLPPGSGYEMNVATYDTSGLSGGDTTDVCMCNETLGSPVVANVVVVGGGSITFTGVDACTTIEIPDVDQFVYSIADQAVTFSGPSVGFSVDANLSEDALFGPSDTQGFSLGLAHDSAIIAVDSIAAINELAALNGGSGPDFFGENLLADGWTVGVVYAFVGGQFIQFGAGVDLVQANYTATGMTDGQVSTLAWSNGLGSPPVANVVVVGGASVDAGFDDGDITFNELLDPNFVRGDCNDDGLVDIADGIWIINELFLSGPTANCAAACDANDDGMVDASDATYIFDYRFMGGAAPAAPFPACGPGGADPATCASTFCP